MITRSKAALKKPRVMFVAQSIEVPQNYEISTQRPRMLYSYEVWI